jgi:hypothetical protein
MPTNSALLHRVASQASALESELRPNPGEIQSRRTRAASQVTTSAIATGPSNAASDTTVSRQPRIGMYRPTSCVEPQIAEEQL